MKTEQQIRQRIADIKGPTSDRCGDSRFQYPSVAVDEKTAAQFAAWFTAIALEWVLEE